MPSIISASPSSSPGIASISISLSMEALQWKRDGSCSLISSKGRCICPTSCRKAVIRPKLTLPSHIPLTPQRKAIAYPSENARAVRILATMLKRVRRIIFE